VPIEGTVLGDLLQQASDKQIDDIEFVRTVAVARITMPRSMVRLSAGRESMSASTQALCFMAGANSIFTGDKLLTAGNAGAEADAALFDKLGLRAMTSDGGHYQDRAAVRGCDLESVFHGRRGIQVHLVASG